MLAFHILGITFFKKFRLHWTVAILSVQMDSAANACAIDDAKENTLDVTPLRPTKYASRASPRTKEMALFLSMPSDVDQYSSFMKHAVEQPHNRVPNECVNSSDSKRSVSTLLEAAQLVNEDGHTG